MSEFDLSGLLEAAAERMAADVKQRFIAHPGEAGKDRE